MYLAGVGGCVVDVDGPDDGAVVVVVEVGTVPPPVIANRSRTRIMARMSAISKLRRLKIPERSG